MKTFESLFAELATKIQAKDPNSETVSAVNKGKHFIGKKIVEEAAEVWMASEYQSKEELAQESAQLIYWIQVMMLESGITVEELYRNL